MLSLRIACCLRIGKAASAGRLLLHKGRTSHYHA